MTSDLTHRQFSRLLVMGFAYSHNQQRYWACQCDCGREVMVSTHSLMSGNAKSCGCLQKEKAGATGKNMFTTHGLSRQNGVKTRLFRIWVGMKTRCYNSNDRAYKNYGQRGIIICDDWLNYENFHQWAISNGYSDTLSIDRIDTHGNYEPNNCRWVNAQTQANNRRNSRKFIYEGKEKTLTELANEHSISVQCLSRRLNAGWDLEKALTTKP